MRAILHWALLVPALIMFSANCAGTAYAQRRVALVIGNSAYVNTPRLENPKNDAADIAASLKQLGFEVAEGRDLDKAFMDRTIRNFADMLAGAQMALFYYAGHGLQVGGQNYLVPVDAKLTSAAALDFETIRMDLVQRTMERETSTNIVILDACRDNPLARNLARALGTRSASIGKGLAAVESGEGTLISFSTQPGNVALDGQGRNSPFAAALLKHIPAPGEDLPTILIKVRNDVMAATERRQVPWEHSALTAKVFFTSPKPTVPTVDLQIELSFWDSVKDSTNPSVLKTYVDRYPHGEFATIAGALIAHFEQQANAAQAARAEEQKRQEEARKAAEVKRLEEERRIKEETLAFERRRANQANDPNVARQLEEKFQAEAIARSEMLRKALDEVAAAREGAKAAEEQRLAAVKAAEAATMAAEQTIAAKRAATDGADPTKVASLPKLETPSGPYDGTWLITNVSQNCRVKRGSFSFVVSAGVVSGGNRSGQISSTGAIRWTSPALVDGHSVVFTGKFSGSSGSGTFTRQDGKCGGTFTAKRE